MNFDIEFNNSRYQKSKYLKYFSHNNINKLVIGLALICLLLTAYLVYIGINLGWLLAIVPAKVFMIWQWYKFDLSNIIPAVNSTKPEAILEPKLLASFKKQILTQENIVDSLYKSDGTLFMANRFGLHPDILKTINWSDTWWNKACELYLQYPNEQGLTSAHIVVAIVLTSPDIKSVMSHTKNREQDIIDGLSWFLYIKKLMNNISQRGQSGGIARDWASGYTPLLNNYAINISNSVKYGKTLKREIIGHQTVVDQITNAFLGGTRANIALVGEQGSGRTTCIEAFTENILFDSKHKNIRYNQVFQLDVTSLLTLVKESAIPRLFQDLALEAYKSKNVILYLDNAGAFFGIDNRVDLTEILLPILEGGRVRFILSFTPKHWQYIQTNKPQIAASLNYQFVSPTNEHDTMRILESQCIFSEFNSKSLFTFESLKEVYRLAERYGPDIAMPGRAISVMDDVAQSNPNKLISKQEVQKTLENSTGIKISTADSGDKNVLKDLESSIQKRVIGQKHAVKAIVNALKRNRSGIGNPNKPIGTFLFLGPTGVGKTELSKTLAKQYFGGDGGFIRVDMNEYITEESINKLLATGTDQGESLLDSVRRKPFSVVLLDEIEKSHPKIVNTLLQMLDEGVMRDLDNRSISFRDAIVIATSNAGADYIRQQIQQHTSIKDLTQDINDKLIQEGLFKPEFINRFDEVVVFEPLTSDDLRQIVFVILSDINQKLAEQGYSVELTQDAVDWIINQGYDNRLGARPLRRMMQKTVESAVSEILLEKQLDHGTVIKLESSELAKTIQ